MFNYELLDLENRVAGNMGLVKPVFFRITNVIVAEADCLSGEKFHRIRLKHESEENLLHELGHANFNEKHPTLDRILKTGERPYYGKKFNF